MTKKEELKEQFRKSINTFLNTEYIDGVLELLMYDVECYENDILFNNSDSKSTNDKIPQEIYLLGHDLEHLQNSQDDLYLLDVSVSDILGNQIKYVHSSKIDGLLTEIQKLNAKHEILGMRLSENAKVFEKNRGHLRYDLSKAYLNYNEKRHAQLVMKELGITYQHATPQSMADQWWFWNCENIPNDLPKYLTPLELDPIECVGFGLSREDAEKIKANESKN